MIPLRDTERAERFPLVNTLLIALNVLVFVWELAQGPALERVFFHYGLVPAYFTHPGASIGGPLAFLPFFTSFFLHGGFLHLLGNMWFLHIFGDNVEDRLGPLRYLLFYLLCGLAAGVSHFLLNWSSTLPTVGASGAIAGVMGAYFVLFPRARVLTLVPIFFFLQVVELPAFVFLGIWVLLQFLYGSLSAAGSSGGVAWWAHFGGFLFGILFLYLLRAMPATGLQQALAPLLRRRSTARLNRVRPSYTMEGGDAEAVLRVSEAESRLGATKLVVVPHGRRQRTLRLQIPPGTRDGTILRLRGLGGPATNGPGDLYLRVEVG